MANLVIPRIRVVDAKFVEQFVPPCRQITTVASSETITDLADADLKSDRKKRNRTAIEIQFRSINYKIINNVQAFNGESVVGNLGGYVGLFLGVAIWKAPDFISFILEQLKM